MYREGKQLRTVLSERLRFYCENSFIEFFATQIGEFLELD